MRTERRPTSVPPQREAPEQVVVRLRRSGRRLVWPALFFVAICFGTGYWWDSFPVAWLNTGFPFVAAGLALLLSLLPLVRWLNRVTIITTKRLILTEGFFVRQRREFPLGRASEVALHRNPLQLLTGSGDVTVTSSEGRLTLHDVPRARLVHRALTELIDRAAPSSA
ncbi:PH domain-containing protein [uncultured Amnibacterium sp.]|uniref:PH domain-containing protein n=1 Tax=uncultured Amnibacterium sp. TaxID=1631851 RepID=UPI0035CA26DD